MYKTIIISFKKFTNFALIFVILISLFSCSLPDFLAWKKEEKNIDTFKSIENLWINEVWVALSINVGTQFYKNQSLKWSDSYNFNNEVISISTINNNQNLANEMLITKNVLALKDYQNILKVDLKWFLSSWDDRQDAFDSLINQLKLRYNNWYKNWNNLIEQIDLLENNKKEIELSLNNIKENINNNLKNYNTQWLSENINNYITTKNNLNKIEIYLIFTKRFLSQYHFLTNYNKDLLNTLILNEDVIVKDSFVIIPWSWRETLDKLNLLYDEQNLIDKAKDLKNSTIRIWTSSYNSIQNKISEIKSSPLLDNLWKNTNNSTKNNSNDLLNIDSNSYDNTNSSEKVWLFWDPFNIKNTDWIVPVYKQTWNINFWEDK